MRLQSCMTEAQKYQGALYKEKPTKQQRQKGKNQATSKQIARSNARPPYVEDAPDADEPISQHPPPPAPSPPPAATGPSKSTTVATSGNAVNVFDFLVTDETPNASKVSLGGTKAQMQMVNHAPSLFEPGKALARLDQDVDDEHREYDIAYEENGFSYGAEPIKPSLYPNQTSNISMEFMTPAPKKSKDRKSSRKNRQASPEDGQINTTSDKKRKRGNTDAANVNTPHGEDTPMLDAPSSVINNAGTPVLNHSGLTVGLDRMLRSDASPTPDYEDYKDEHGNRRFQEPVSPLRRSRRADKETANENGLGISVKGKAGRIMSMFGGSALSGSSGSSNEPPSKALVRTRRRSSSEEEEGSRSLAKVHKSKKTHRVRNASDGHVISEPRKSKRKTSVQINGDGHYELSRPSRRVKMIDYHKDSDRSRSRSPRGEGRSHGENDRRMVVYRHSKTSDDELLREKARHFLSLVNKGPESERGCSVHKALKRFHRDFPSLAGSEDGDSARGRGRGRSRDRKAEDERELFRTLRLKRNDRGEIVVFF
ncbi:hypothetical protein DTO212C5_1953 [Paecilomyces variotii]|nr:hypothetical protein DTO212C5_1953 [Paecilomyces variotii]